MIQKENGFTLIEILIAISGFAIVGLVVMNILINSLRGSVRANLITAERYSGENAIEQMSRTLRSGVSMINPPLPCSSTGTTTQQISFTAVSGQSYTYKCTGVNGTIVNASNVSLLDTNVVKINSTCQFVCSQATTSDSPVISISFDLIPANANNLVERYLAPLTFTTSVLMRNIHK